jgi:hypothetical protein
MARRRTMVERAPARRCAAAWRRHATRCAARDRRRRTHVPPSSRCPPRSTSTCTQWGGHVTSMPSQTENPASWAGGCGCEPDADASRMRMRAGCGCEQDADASRMRMRAGPSQTENPCRAEPQPGRAATWSSRNGPLPPESTMRQCAVSQCPAGPGPVSAGPGLGPSSGPGMRGLTLARPRHALATL